MSYMLWNFFVLAAFYLFLPTIYVTMRNNAVAKNNLVLSVTLPPQAHGDKEVMDYCQEYRRKLRRLFWILTAALLPWGFLPWISVVLTVSLVWMLAAMVLLFWFYGRAYKGLREVKRRRGWQTPAAGQTVVELKPMGLPKPLRTGWFVPPMLLSALPALSCVLDPWDPVWGLTLVITAVSCLLLTVMSLLFYGLLFRQRADAVNADTDLTAALTRVRRYHWTKMWLFLSWMTGLYSMAVWCSLGSMAWYLVWTALYTVALLIACLTTEFAARRAQRRLTAGLTETPQVDEDDCWIWGQFYYNPNNNRLFVNERVGIGMSMNMARPAARILTGLCALLLLALPLFGAWCMAEEFSPIRLTLTQDTVTVRHALTEYQVPLDQVEDAAVLSKLPPAGRVWGTAMNTLLKGSFSVNGYGMATLCLDPAAEEFLVLQTEETTYIFSGPPTVIEACMEKIDNGASCASPSLFTPPKAMLWT